MRIKEFVVDALEWTCDRFDLMYQWPKPFKYLYYLNGRSCWMANLSMQLDERWNTGRWRPTPGGDHGNKRDRLRREAEEQRRQAEEFRWDVGKHLEFGVSDLHVVGFDCVRIGCRIHVEHKHEYGCDPIYPDPGGGDGSTA